MDAYSAGSKRLIQLVAALGSSIAPFMVASLIVATPVIGVEFGADVSLLGWVTSAFFLTSAAFLVPFGRIADIRGARRVFTLGIAVYGIAAVISGLAPSILVLIAGRALTGIGAAMVFGTSIALLSLVFPPQERVRALGINVTGMFMGFIIGFLLGGALTYYASWRILFLIVILLAAADLALILSRVRRECELARETDYDIRGMFLYTPGALLAIYGLSGIQGPLGPWSLGVGLLVLAVFGWWERRAGHPLFPPDIRGNRLFLLAGVTNVVFQAGGFAVLFLLSLHFQYVLGIDPLIAGFLLIIPQALVVFIAPWSGHLSARLHPHSVGGIGCVLNGIAMLLLTGLGQQTPLSLLILAIALNGVAYALFMPAVLGWAIGIVGRKTYGVASGLTETTRLSGITVSNAVVIVVFALVMGTTPVSPGVIPQFLLSARISFVIYTALSFVAAALALALAYRLERPARPGSTGKKNKAV